MRDRRSLHYFEVHAGFVRRMVNANSYTAQRGAGIIRSIYAYHTQSKGWSDIGYNFLVDRFGRIWEGRYGGVDRPVVGAHTLATTTTRSRCRRSATTTSPSPADAMLQAYGALFAWKLSLHGVDAARPASRSARPVPGDQRPPRRRRRPPARAATSTPRSRRSGARRRGPARLERARAGVRPRRRPAPRPRRAAGQRRQAFVIPTGGLTSFGARGRHGAGRERARHGVVARPTSPATARRPARPRPTAAPRVLPGDGDGGFGDPVEESPPAFRGRDLITAVGDLNGDGRNDLVARDPSPAAWTSTAVAARRLRGPALAGHRLGWLHRDRRHRGPRRRRPGGPAGPRRRQQDVAAARARAGPPRRGRPGPRQVGALRHHGGLRRLQRRRAPRPARGRDRWRDLPAAGPRRRHLRASARPVHRAARHHRARRGRPDRHRCVRRAGPARAPAWSSTPARAPTRPARPSPPASSCPTPTPCSNAGDWDRDGLGDLVTRQQSTGSLFLRSRQRHAAVRRPAPHRHRLRQRPLLAAVGDMTGDGWPDLMGQPSGGAMRIYPGHGATGLAPSYVALPRGRRLRRRSASAAGTATAPPTACSARATG